MKNNVIKAQEYGLDEQQVSNVDQAFAEKVAERELLSEVYAQVISKDITPEVAQEARELRLKAVKVKSGIASIHKTQKEFALAFGKYCDAWKRKETEPVQQMIDGLLEIEKYQEIQEQKRLEALQAERVELLSPYVQDAHERDLSSMEDDVWNAYLSTKKKEHEALLEAQRKAEEERIAKEKAEAEERERIRKENEKLRKEAQERERKAKEEEAARAKIEAERLAKEAQERKEREEKERKEREAHEAALKAEREKQAQLADELKAKQEAEQKAKEEEEARLQAELNKGDADKVKDLITDLESLKTKYSFKSAKNKQMYSQVSTLLDKVINHIS